MGQGLNRLAVVLRGHKRTWDWTKKHTFEYFARESEQVDYYVVLWKGPNFTAEQIRSDFQGQNLKHLEILDPVAKYYHPFDGPAYLSNIASEYIFKEEIVNGRYDAVIDTRCDVGFNPRVFPNFTPPPPMSVLTTRYQPTPVDNGGGMTAVWEGLEDHFFMMDSTTYALWNQRFRLTAEFRDRMTWTTGNHSMLMFYANFHNITVYTNPILQCEISRPPIAYATLTDYNYCIHQSRDQWNSYSIEQKKQAMLDANICEDEYFHAVGIYHPPENN